MELHLSPLTAAHPATVKHWLLSLALFNAFHTSGRPNDCASASLERSLERFLCSLHHFSPLYAFPDLLNQLFVITVIWTTCWWPPTHQTQITSFPLNKTLNCFQVLSMTAFSGWPLGSKTLVLARSHLNRKWLNNYCGWLITGAIVAVSKPWLGRLKVKLTQNLSKMVHTSSN